MVFRGIFFQVSLWGKSIINKQYSSILVRFICRFLSVKTIKLYVYVDYLYVKID